MKKKILSILTLLCVCCLVGSAQNRNELRLGVGSNAFERVFFPNSDHMSYVDRPEEGTYMEKQSHRYLPHIFAEYGYTIEPWITVGAQVDFSGFSWKDCYYKGGSDAVVSTQEQNCYNIVIQGICRFNWFRREVVSLYSGLGLGADINTGTEVDPYGKKTIPGIALTPILIGVNVGKGHWFGSFELSFINAMKDPSQLFLVGARPLSLSLGYRF